MATTATPWVGFSNDKLYLQSGQFSATLKTSEDLSGIDDLPLGISWDGTNTPACGFTDDSLYLFSGQFSLTLKSSLAVNSIDSSPRGIEDSDVDARLGVGGGGRIMSSLAGWGGLAGYGGIAGVGGGLAG